MEKKLLITGFEPFGGETLNPSWLAVERLPEQIGDYRIYKRKIPTVFGKAAQTVLLAAEEIHPDVILCVGQAGGRTSVTQERVGINVRSARICDNEGNQPWEEPIVPEGPDGLFSTLPVQTMAAAIEKEGLPGQVSNTAGTFVCNDTLYTLLYHYRNTAVRVGFVHVPYLPEQGNPNLSLTKITMALEAAIKVM